MGELQIGDLGAKDNDGEGYDSNAFDEGFGEGFDNDFGEEKDDLE